MSSQWKFTEAAEKVVVAAQNLARENSNVTVSPFHLASALLEDSQEAAGSSSSLLVNVLEKAGADVQAVKRGVAKAVVRLPSQDPPPEDISFGGPALRILRDAQKASKEGGDTFIGTVHLITAMISDPQVGGIIKEAGGTEDAVKQAVAAVRAGKKVDSKQAEDGFEALNKYAIDLTALAADGKLDPVLARNDEIRRCIRILSRRTKNNPVLIGEPGVGKTAIAEGLAQRIVQRDVPVNLLGKLYSLDLGALQAGASYRGQYEERVKAVIEECENADNNIILFIDELHLLLSGQGSSGGGMDAANLLKPSMARGRIRVIGATTLAEYRKYVEKDAALVRRFQEVLVNEPDTSTTISILRGIREKYEIHHNVVIRDDAIVQAAHLAHRYLTSRRLPDAAIDLIDEACAAVRVARDSQPESIDKLQRARTQLEVEIHALEREHDKAKGKDEGINERLEAARAQLRVVDDELDPLRAQYESYKHRSDELQACRERIDELKQKADRAERNYDISTASDIRYYSIPDMQAKLEKLEALKKTEDAQRGNILGEDEVTPEAIADIVSKWTGIPAASLKQSEKEKLLKMEARLSREVVGQPEAVKAVANAIRVSRSGLANPDRPIASLLFAGPSGTGKTQLCKSLAKFMFDSESAMTRIDASEYSEKHSISRLIGAPPGYVGYDQGGILTESVRRQNHQIILVDELEKACKEFTTLLLQVLEDGRLTDSNGTTVNFKNTIIIFTSNLGSQYLNALPPNSSVTAEAKESVMGAIRAHLLPEFINRLDGIIVFSPLGQKQILSIVDIRLKEVQKRLQANGRKVILDVDESAKQWLSDVGYNPAYGARPLNRMITQELLNPLSRYLIEERIKDGEVAHVTADFKANRLVIKENHPSSINYEDGGMDVDIEDVEEDLD